MQTRRRFVETGAWAAAAGLPALHGAAIAQQPPPHAPPGVQPIPGAVLRVLMATAEATTGVQSLRGHYEAYFRHQALYRRGYHDMYARFAEAVEATAGAVGLEDFAAAGLRARSGILDNLRARPDVAQDYEIAVFQEILAVFARTDAWLALGYSSWEGSPRGLDEYRRPPGAVR